MKSKKADQINFLKLDIQKEIKVIYIKTTGVCIYNKKVDLAKLIDRYASNTEKSKGIPIIEGYKLFDFDKLEKYYRETHKNNNKNLQLSLKKLENFKSEFSKLKKACNTIDSTMKSEKEKYSLVLKTNIRIIKKEDIKNITTSLKSLLEKSLKNINFDIIDEMLIELKSNLKRLIYIQLKRYNINFSKDLEADLNKILDNLSTGMLIKNNINFDLDLILDISEELILNDSYYKILVELIGDDNSLLEKAKTLKLLLT